MNNKFKYLGLLSFILMGCNSHVSTTSMTSSSLTKVKLSVLEAKERMQDILDNYNDYFYQYINIEVTIDSKIPELENWLPFKAHTITEKKYDNDTKVYYEQGKTYMNNEWRDNLDQTYYHWENEKTYIYDDYRKTYEFYNDKDAVILLNKANDIYNRGKESYEKLETLINFIDNNNTSLSTYTFESSGLGNLTVICSNSSFPVCHYLNFENYLIVESTFNRMEHFGSLPVGGDVYDNLENCKFSYDLSLEVPNKDEFKYNLNMLSF